MPSLGAAAAERPDHRQHKVDLERSLVRLGVDILGPQQALEDVSIVWRSS